MFCPKCGSLLLPSEGKMKCSCGYSQQEGKITEKKKEVKDVEVMKKGQAETHPKIEAECEKCGNNEAFTWNLQTRSSDEPETIFFKCTKCEHTWRSYG